MLRHDREARDGADTLFFFLDLDQSETAAVKVTFLKFCCTPDRLIDSRNRVPSTLCTLLEVRSLGPRVLGDASNRRAFRETFWRRSLEAHLVFQDTTKLFWSKLDGIDYRALKCCGALEPKNGCWVGNT